jgi:ABC-type transport system involved in cytochrome bd biosynthesis fused ATPase/permease subunit
VERIEHMAQSLQHVTFKTKGYPLYEHHDRMPATLVVVTQALSLVDHFDMIVVIGRDSTIVESGDRQELLKRKGNVP